MPTGTHHTGKANQWFLERVSLTEFSLFNVHRTFRVQLACGSLRGVGDLENVSRVLTQANTGDRRIIDGTFVYLRTALGFDIDQATSCGRTLGLIIFYPQNLMFKNPVFLATKIDFVSSESSTL